MVVLAVAVLVLAAALVFFGLRLRRASREQYIRTFLFPPGLFEKLRQKRPELSLKDCQLVSRALRQFFLAHLKSGRRFVSMPSQAADDLWHELILYTRLYEAFCNKAFGTFLHHTPAVVLGAGRLDNTGLRRTWRYACLDENINPLRSLRLPLLFAIDAKLNIADGFHYSPRCEALRRNSSGAVYCGGDFSSTSYDGGTDGLSDSPLAGSDTFSPGSGSSDSSGGDSSSCGGGGCGGGGD